MKFEIQFLPSNKLSDYLEKLPNKALSNSRIDTPYKSDTYYKVLAASESHGEFDCFINISLSKKELDTIQSFRMVCNKNPPVSDSDGKAAYKHFESVTKDYPKDLTPYHLIETQYISKTLIKPEAHQIFGLQSSSLPFITKSVKRILPKEWEEKYFSILPVQNRITEAIRDDIFILRPNTLLNAFHKDESISIDHNEWGTYYRAHGMLTFSESEIERKIPIAFTKERLNNAGIIIVDIAFVHFIKENKIKGLKFWPILMHESDLYEEYIETWKAIKKDLSINTKNNFSFFEEPVV